MIGPIDAAKRQLARATQRIHVLPLLVLMPHGSCDCRCVMCDIWKANRERRELSLADLAAHLEPLRRLRVQRIVLSGGEALLHSNLWSLCDALAATGARLTLLTTGVSLARHAEDVRRWFDEVIVSLDGPASVHDRIRRVEGTFERLARGVSALRSAASRPSLRGRCVVQRANHRCLPAVVSEARKLGLDQISFLPVDVSSTAFNRPRPWSQERGDRVALSVAEAKELCRDIDALIEAHRADLESGFIAEPAAKLRQIGDYFLALQGKAPFPPKRCNAPWVSAVVEADGAVRPCFFHPAYGQLDDDSLDGILNSRAAVGFRRQLDIRTDPICERCVCSLYLSPIAPV